MSNNTSFLVNNTVVTPNAVTAALNQGDTTSTVKSVPQVTTAATTNSAVSGTYYLPVLVSGQQVYLPRGIVSAAVTAVATGSSSLVFSTSPASQPISTTAPASLSVVATALPSSTTVYASVLAQGVNSTPGYLYCITTSSGSLVPITVVTSTVTF